VLDIWRNWNASEAWHSRRVSRLTSQVQIFLFCDTQIVKEDFVEVWTPVFRFTSHARPSPGTEGSPGVLRPMIATRRTCDFQFSLFAIWGVDHCRSVRFRSDSFQFSTPRIWTQSFANVHPTRGKVPLRRSTMCSTVVTCGRIPAMSKGMRCGCRAMEIWAICICRWLMWFTDSTVWFSEGKCCKLKFQWVWIVYMPSSSGMLDGLLLDMPRCCNCSIVFCWHQLPLCHASAIVDADQYWKSRTMLWLSWIHGDSWGPMGPRGSEISMNF